MFIFSVLKNEIGVSVGGGGGMGGGGSAGSSDQDYSWKTTIKFLNFVTPGNFAVIYLKFKHRDQTLGYFIKRMQR